MSLGWRNSNPSGPQFSGDPSTCKPLASEPEPDQHDPGESLPEVAGGVQGFAAGFLNSNETRSFEIW